MQGILLASKTIRVSNAVAAGTSVVNTTVVDMTGFDSVLFTALFGALTASQVTSIKAQGGNAANLSDAVDLVGAVTNNLADADGNKMLQLEVVKPVAYRYMRLVVTRGTANAVIDGVIAQLMSTRKAPETIDTTVSDALVSVSPRVSTTGLTSTTTTYSSTSVRVNQTARTSS